MLGNTLRRTRRLVAVTTTVTTLLLAAAPKGFTDSTGPVYNLSTIGDASVVYLSWDVPFPTPPPAGWIQFVPPFTYKIYRGTSPGAETLLSSTADTAFADRVVNNTTAYYYQVSVVNVAGQEAPRSFEVVGSAAEAVPSGYTPAQFDSVGTVQFDGPSPLSATFAPGDVAARPPDASPSQANLPDPSGGENPPGGSPNDMTPNMFDATPRSEIPAQAVASFHGPGDTASPADTTIAAGGGDLADAVNEVLGRDQSDSLLEFRTDQGILVASEHVARNFRSGLNLTDPWLIYDQISGRFWFLATGVFSPYRLFLAVSPRGTVYGTGLRRTL